LATGFLYCILFIAILSAFAEPLCWFCIVVVQLGLIGLPIVAGYKYMEVKKALDSPDLVDK
jgi:hypothetical protein